MREPMPRHHRSPPQDYSHRVPCGSCQDDCACLSVIFVLKRSPRTSTMCDHTPDVRLQPIIILSLCRWILCYARRCHASCLYVIVSSTKIEKGLSGPSAGFPIVTLLIMQFCDERVCTTVNWFQLFKLFKYC